MPLGAHKMATADKGDSSWAYLSRYVYHQPLPESHKSRNRYPGAIIDDPGKRFRPNTSKRSLDEPEGTHRMVLEDMCCIVCVYLLTE